MLFGLEFTLILDSSSHPWRSSDTRIPRVTVLHMSQKKCCKSKHQQIFWATKLRSWCIKASESFREFVKASGANRLQSWPRTKDQTTMLDRLNFFRHLLTLGAANGNLPRSLGSIFQKWNTNIAKPWATPRWEIFLPKPRCCNHEEQALLQHLSWAPKE